MALTNIAPVKAETVIITWVAAMASVEMISPSGEPS